MEDIQSRNDFKLLQYDFLPCLIDIRDDIQDDIQDDTQDDTLALSGLSLALSGSFSDSGPVMV